MQFEMKPKDLLTARWITTLIVLPFFQGVLCLEMLGITGPESVNEGDTVSLTCRYDLGRDAIYSMKWFKEDSEIYRYIPTDTPEFKHFNAPGIEIESASTRPNLLVMKVVGPLASGEYTCEITVETPSFITLDRTHNLTVIVPPRLAPAITGIDTYYHPGDLVEISCQSKDSKPAPMLKWILNGKPAPKGYLLSYNKHMNHTTGLESAEHGMRFTAEPAHFPKGEMRLQCIAEIDGVWKTHVEGVALGGANPGEGRGPNRLLVRNKGTKNIPYNASSSTNIVLSFISAVLISQTIL